MHVGHSTADEVGLLKGLRVDRHVGRQAGPQHAQGGLDAPGDVERVGLRLLLDRRHHGRPPIEASVAALVRGAHADRRHLTDQDGHALANGDHRAGQVVDGMHTSPSPDQQLVVRPLEEAATARRIGRGDRPGELGQGHTVRRQPRGIGDDLILLALAADDGHLRHAGHAKQARPHDPVRQRTKLHG